MTGDPNQQNRPSVFGLDYNYPGVNTVDWTKLQSPSASVPNGPFPSFAQSPMIDPQITNFSFCTTTRSSVPVQFPFVKDIPPTIPVSQQPMQPHHEQAGDFGNRSLHIPIRCKRKTDSPL